MKKKSNFENFLRRKNFKLGINGLWKIVDHLKRLT